MHDKIFWQYCSILNTLTDTLMRKKQSQSSTSHIGYYDRWFVSASLLLHQHLTGARPQAREPKGAQLRSELGGGRRLLAAVPKREFDRLFAYWLNVSVLLIRPLPHEFYPSGKGKQGLEPIGN